MTERIPHTDFPSDETLAAFIDGRLDPEMRQKVVDHIATCPECYDVVLGAQQMGAEATSGSVAPFRRSRVMVISLAAAAVAAFALLFVGPLRERLFPRQTTGLAALAQVAPPERNIEGRLSGFPYRPLKVMRGGTGDDTSPERVRLLSVAAEVEGEARKNPEPQNLHAYGVSLLMLGNDTAAIDALQRAVQAATGESAPAAALRKSTDAELLSDLASAYLAHGDPVSAHDAADRAYRLRSTPHTAWNRALAVEKLHPGDQAVDAWSDYLKLDSTSPWAEEARRRRENTAARPSKS
jgi:Flp pilus assembly protein TadD